MSAIYDIEVTTIKGETKSLSDYKGKTLLVVNTASKCGFTPQFKGLESLYETYKEQGLEILGFPCNQFLSQDPGSDSQISEFCELNYGVTFPMFSKVDVNGPDTHPLFSLLKTNAKGMLGSEKIKWNFTKFLVNAEGEILKRYAPKTEPKAIEQDIKDLLA
ncbi:glutathione peroxidase [Oleiphilus sp. HI0009]|nr:MULTISPECIES: glutathione peroxidase [unclassified Oleiphilus]KZX82360.1 glutathione peroxidase [Oleiphilus sp. HI0009]MCH2159749.1 glutathione peroxidase [Oleiphilaceae bacterium]KZX83623.1 glutathione peroxidase [Oleiphilus sp. HI0009]KZY64312.1 glutathione peroxidase [Oleiphilus sp. HI0066]KZY66974.1 glutathione peroxidase [Oleiphilus sp. HI0067]